jgi:hypothetical protein
MTRPDVDSVALVTEPTLEAWGIPFEACVPGDDPAAAVAALVQRARQREFPCALLVTTDLI